MLLYRFYTPGLAINSYLIADDDTKRAAVIDPTREVGSYIQLAKEQGLKITDIIETHVHADFISGSQELKEQLSQKVTIHCSAEGGKLWIPLYADHAVKEGESIHLGKLRLQALHTPGHTPEHLIWLCYDEARSLQLPCLAFTGDLLFVGSAGRPDLLGEGETKHLAEQLYTSLFSKLNSLPDFLELFPGHGAGSLCGKKLDSRPTSTLGYERLFNPCLYQKPFKEWVEELQKEIPAAPIRFQKMKQMNLQGSLSSPIQEGKLVLDIRDPEAFAKGHLKGSINIFLAPSFCNWVSSVIEGNPSIHLIADQQESLQQAAKNLHLIGLDSIVKMQTWEEAQADQEIESLPLKSVKQLELLGDSNYILDVRSLSEWNARHIAGAHHLELACLVKDVHKIPKDIPILTICGSGYRASIAASWLKSQGYQDVVNVKGGMASWKQANLPYVESDAT